MGRTTLTRTTLLGPYPTLPVSANALDVTMTAADVANDNQFVLDGPCIIIAHNTDVGAQTITLTSVADAQNRTGDITTYSIGAGEIAAFHVGKTGGWVQSDGYMYLEASDAGVEIGILRGYN